MTACRIRRVLCSGADADPRAADPREDDARGADAEPDVGCAVVVDVTACCRRA
jgi:hypothetical protein